MNSNLQAVRCIVDDLNATEVHQQIIWPEYRPVGLIRDLRKIRNIRHALFLSFRLLYVACMNNVAGRRHLEQAGHGRI
jgi:hypothetical protein